MCTKDCYKKHPQATSLTGLVFPPRGTVRILEKVDIANSLKKRIVHRHRPRKQRFALYPLCPALEYNSGTTHKAGGHPKYQDLHIFSQKFWENTLNAFKIVFLHSERKLGIDTSFIQSRSLHPDLSTDRRPPVGHDRHAEFW